MVPTKVYSGRAGKPRQPSPGGRASRQKRPPTKRRQNGKDQAKPMIERRRPQSIMHAPRHENVAELERIKSNFAMRY